MSSVSPFQRSWDVRPGRGAQFVRRLMVSSVQFAGFWSAIALPFVLLAMLFVGAAAEQTGLFAGLVGTNLVALRLGREYNRD